MAGYDRLAALWERAGGSSIEPYPSIALGAFETTPLEMASAYGVLATNGRLHEAALAALSRISA